jgi:hypothetical protein
MHTVGSLLPEYRTKALNAGSNTGNLIHHDEYARRYGFRGGLVPGASLYAYMTRSLVEFLGRDWLERGSAEVRFVHPVYEGEEIRISGCLSSITKSGTLQIDCEGANSQGVTCMVGTAELPQQSPAAEPKPDDYPAGRGRLGRPISLDQLKVGTCLTPIFSEFTWNIHWEYCQKTVRDHHPIYRQLLHPGWLLSQANRIFAANYELTAWIHVSSMMQHFHAQDAECVVETRGRIVEKFERNGHHHVVLDVALFTNQRCLETIRQAVIFRIAPRAA